METFLEQLDMSNLKTLIENDSDYDDEFAFGCSEKQSQGGMSMKGSHSVKSNTRSPKNKYKRPSIQ